MDLYLLRSFVYRMEEVNAIGPARQKVAKLYLKDSDDIRDSEAAYRKDVQIQVHALLHLPLSHYLGS